MARRVEFLDQARLELEGATLWYLERSPRAAEGFLREVERGLLLITEDPTLWLKYEAGTRRYLLREYPYSIVYRDTGSAVVVVAVSHHKRKPGYWLSREQ